MKVHWKIDWKSIRLPESDSGGKQQHKTEPVLSLGTMSDLDVAQWKEVVAEVTKPRSGAELTELVNTAASDEDGLEEVQVQLDEVFKQLCVQLGPIASEERERREMELWTLLYERLPTARQSNDISCKTGADLI